jgi:hypothetical protein
MVELAVFRCYGVSKITASALTWLELFVGRESPLGGLPPLSGPSTGDVRRSRCWQPN